MLDFERSHGRVCHIISWPRYKYRDCLAPRHDRFHCVRRRFVIDFISLFILDGSVRSINGARVWIP